MSEVWAKVTVKAQEQQEYIKALTRGVFGILQNIYDRCFLRKYLTAFNHLPFSQKAPSEMFDST